MGAGSTAGNAGQLMSISGTINATTESAAYTYDNLGRLVTSNQTSNGLSAQRRFAYERWGNRTGVWDAVSGGSQIQSVVLQQSGGAPTNQLQSVTTSGVTKNYSYDAAGNVTNDGVHSYTYDGENRLVSVDGGATAQYAYDHNNRRYKKTVGSAVTHCVWEGSQVVAEHDGTTGAVIGDYVYSGSRMLTKVSGGTTQYFLSDRLSARLVLDTSGNVLGRESHLPFGEDFGESGTQEKHHFTSYERDSESASDYAVNRQYSATVGRFNRVDPHGGSYSSGVPQTLNRYSYVGNDPVNATDPLGLKTYEMCQMESDGCLHCYTETGGHRVICPHDFPDQGGSEWHNYVRPGGYDSPEKPDSFTRAVDKAFDRVEGIFKNNPDSECAKYFGADALQVLEALRRKATIASKTDAPGATATGIRQTYGQGSTTSSGYRLPATFTVFRNGPFFAGGKGSIGGYPPGMYATQNLALLHELAHDILVDGKPKIPDDGNNPNLSADNTAEILKHCKQEVFDAKK